METLVEKYKFWSVIDWSKTDHEISELTNKSLSLVRRYRNDFNPIGTPYHKGKRKQRYCPHSYNEKVSVEKWNSIDWDKQDIELSKELNVSRERVRQVRIMLKKQQPINHHKHTKYSKTLIRHNKAVEKLHAGADRFKDMLMVDIAKEICESLCYTQKLIFDNNIPHKDGRFYGHSKHYNFELPNNTLNEIWDIVNCATANTDQPPPNNGGS